MYCKIWIFYVNQNCICIAIFTVSTEVIESCYIQISMNYKQSDKTILPTRIFAYDEKLEAFQNQIGIEGKQAYFKYAETLDLRCYI